MLGADASSPTLQVAIPPYGTSFGFPPLSKKMWSGLVLMVYVVYSTHPETNTLSLYLVQNFTYSQKGSNTWSQTEFSPRVVEEIHRRDRNKCENEALEAASGFIQPNGVLTIKFS